MKKCKKSEKIREKKEQNKDNEQYDGTFID